MKRDIHRPLRIVHGDFGFKPEDSYEEKCRCVRARMEELKAKGYGGIVTNVAFQNYLEDADEWKLMKLKAELCKELGMRMWLYDEDAYPSGAAGTHTLDKNPDFEARGLVVVAHVLAPGETLVQALPHGHEKLVSAVCCTMEGDVPRDEDLLNPIARPTGEPVRFVNDTEKNMLCLAFYQKHLYEGTHAQNNVAYHRRYVDLSNPEAIAEFINNTYRPYTEAVGEFYAKAIGDENENAVIEAIFTDEPSYMGVYINKGLAELKVVHPVDREIPLYPLVNWGKNVANRFASRYGYRLEDELTALFFGHGEHFCQVRHDYYQLMSDLYEQAFFAQLSDYCSQVGLNFSGHILLEDEMPLHVMFEGNFFNLLRHMHVPGIDMLQGLPDKVWDFAFTPLLVRSIAELYGRPHVMDECSAHQQGGKVTVEETYVSLMLQLAFGADVFTSYYSDDDPDGSKKKMLDALTRAAEAITGPRLSDTLLLYPIETMMRRRKPLMHGIENVYIPLLQESEGPGKAVIKACTAAMEGAQFAMLNAQKSFTYIDAGTALQQPAGKWKNMVVGACDVTPALVTALEKLAAGGTRTIWYAPAGSELLDDGFARLPAGSVRAASEAELVALLCPEGTLLTGENTAGIALAESAGHVLLVNRDTDAKAVCWHGAFTALCNAADGEAVPAAQDTDGVHFVLNGSTALILKK